MSEEERQKEVPLAAPAEQFHAVRGHQERRRRRKAMGQWFSRHKRQLAILAAAILLVASASAVAWWFWVASSEKEGLSKKIEILGVVRPRDLRCGSATIDNLCPNDIVYIQARMTKMLLIYRYDTLWKRDDGLVFSCPSADPRCIQFSDGFIVGYQLVGQADFEVVALPELAKEVGSFDQVHRDHLGKYERVVLKVQHL